MTLHTATVSLGLAILSGALQPQSVSPAALCTHVVERGPITDPGIKAVVKNLLVSYLSPFNPELAKGVAAGDVDVSHAFGQGGWTVYRVAAPALGLDPGFVFVNRSAAPGRPPYVWSGSAMPDERADIRAEIRKNNKGIGGDLTACIVETIVGREQ